ncbi:MAG: DNA/RNA non-specific endonuclease [Bacteroidales bacterium]|nr:DNA/RNA non-specific endonuclease [Bacteroidales bacterium]
MALKNKIALWLAACAIAAAATACAEKIDYLFTVDVRHLDVDADRGTQFVRVTSAPDEAWTLSVTDLAGNPITWATVDPANGVGPTASATVTWDKNHEEEARTMVLHLASGSKNDAVEVVQAAAKSSGSGTLPTTIVPDKVPGWLELPATDNADLYFFSHTNATGRNYSYYWDVNALVAHWVAYPLNKNLIGSGSRTNEWGLDPKLPRNAQPVLFSGYGSGSGSGNSDGGTQWYQRGHQLPSADRLNYSDNVQTFYGTNMTPQIGELNEQIWASLEGRVRDWAKQFDTLYVVTGCVVKGSTAFAYDNDGKKVTVPVGYYKALLGYDKGRAKGITSQTQGYTGVGFYLEHRGYGNADYMTCAMTIDALEAKVGEDFYVNLPKVIGETLYNKVESTKDNYWWNGN